MPPSHLILVPGFWEGPGCYAWIIPGLETLGYDVRTVTLPSTGRRSTDPEGYPTMYDDVDFIRSVIRECVEEGHDVLVVAHSAGAVLSASATQGLSKKERQKDDKRGGVVKFAFIAAGLLDVGVKHPPMPFFEVKDGGMVCKSPRELLFNDIKDDKLANRLVDSLRCQPALKWDEEIKHAGWKDIPSGYLVANKDQLLPAEFQRQMADMAGSNPIMACDGGHCAQITQPKVVIDFIDKVAQSA